MRKSKLRRLAMKRIKVQAEIEAINELITRLKSVPEYYATTLVNDKVKRAELDHLIGGK